MPPASEFVVDGGLIDFVLTEQRRASSTCTVFQVKQTPSRPSDEDELLGYATRLLASVFPPPETFLWWSSPNENLHNTPPAVHWFQSDQTRCEVLDLIEAFVVG